MTILVVDNDKWVLNGIEKLITMSGCNVEIELYSSSREALKYALNEKPMLIIADVEMPEIDGLELCEKLVQVYRPHIIIISGYDKFQYAQEAIRLGVSNYILKPINQKEFISLIKKELLTIEQERMKKNVLEQNICSGFLENIYIGKDDSLFVKDFIDLYGMEMRKKSYAFAYAAINDFSAVKKIVCLNETEDNKYTAFLKYIEKNCPDNVISSELRHGSLAFCIIGDIVSFKGWMESLIEKAQEYCCQITVGISEGSKDTGCLLEQFRQAMEALQDKFYYGQNAVYSYKKVLTETSKSNVQRFLLVHNWAERIIDTLLNSGSEEEMKKCISDLIDRLLELFYSREEIVLFFQELLLLTVHRLAHASDIQMNVREINMPDDIFDSCETLQEIKKTYVEYMWSLYVNVQGQMIHNADSIQYVTDKMLREECANVSLDAIADRCNLHRNYLSIIFKEKVGINFKEYVLKYKMKRAKYLLRTSNIKMSCIAEELGYMDVKNFSRAFKTYTGHSPSEYRNFSEDT